MRDACEDYTLTAQSYRVLRWYNELAACKIACMTEIDLHSVLWMDLYAPVLNRNGVSVSIAVVRLLLPSDCRHRQAICRAVGPARTSTAAARESRRLGCCRGGLGRVGPFEDHPSFINHA